MAEDWADANVDVAEFAGCGAIGNASCVGNVISELYPPEPQATMMTAPYWAAPQGPCSGMEGMSPACGEPPPAPGMPPQPLPPSGPTNRPGCGAACVGGIGVAAICLLEPELCAWAIAPPIPPPPPPPPQDQFAHGRKPPPAPKALRHDENVTSKARDVKDPNRIPAKDTIDEPDRFPEKRLRETGDAADNADKAAHAQEGGGGNGAPSQPTNEVGNPDLPKAPGDTPESPGKGLKTWQRIAINSGVGAVGSVVSDVVHGARGGWKQIVEDAISGTVTGSLGGIFTKVPAVLFSDAVGGAADSAITQRVDKGTVNRNQVLAQGGLSAVVGALGYAAGLLTKIPALTNSFGNEENAKLFVPNIGYSIADLFGSSCNPTNAIVGEAVC